jgi:hypothetical protein
MGGKARLLAEIGFPMFNSPMLSKSYVCSAAFIGFSVRRIEARRYSPPLSESLSNVAYELTRYANVPVMLAMGGEARWNWNGCVGSQCVSFMTELEKGGR